MCGDQFFIAANPGQIQATMQSFTRQLPDAQTFASATSAHARELAVPVIDDESRARLNTNAGDILAGVAKIAPCCDATVIVAAIVQLVRDLPDDQRLAVLASINPVADFETLTTYCRSLHGCAQLALAHRLASASGYLLVRRDANTPDVPPLPCGLMHMSL